jgi:L-ascorbate metabolism protein UlaG (beta-lactamase superfamily)
MEITWHGNSCFRLKDRGLATVVTDPYDHRIVGYKELDISADIITVSNDTPEHNYTEIVRKRKGDQHILTGPGEYEIGGVFITAIRTNGSGKRKKDEPRNHMFIFDYNGVLVAHMGNLNRVPSQSDVKSIAGDVHVALIPVGGGSGLNSSQAVEVIRMLEPSYAVPMHYKTPQSKLDLVPLDKFTKEMGLDKIQPREELRVTSTKSSTETRVVVLEYQSSIA